MVPASKAAENPSAKSVTPVVAILTYRDGTRIFRGNRFNFLELLRTAEEEGVTAYIVTHDHLDLHSRTIKGYSYNASKKKWVQKERPFPNVVYNRIPYRKFEQLPEVQQLIQECLLHPRIRFFNPSFFSKWSLFEWLRDSRVTRNHIPETIKLSSAAEFARLVRTHKNVYLKPIKGKAGKGIMKVQRLEGKKAADGKYRLTYQDTNGTVTTAYDSETRLYEAVKRHMGGKEYIAQQGITLARTGGRPFDLRVLVQKNAKGEWRISGIGARVAGVSSITTHVPRGGSIDDPEKLLCNVFGTTTGKAILRDARATALLLAIQIEKGSGYNLGEMSMDLGVDKNGKLWFFEANSKPMKFDEPHIRKTSLRRLVRYWKFLVNQPSEKRSSVHSLRKRRWRGKKRRKRRIR